MKVAPISKAKNSLTEVKSFNAFFGNAKHYLCCFSRSKRLGLNLVVYQRKRCLNSKKI